MPKLRKVILKRQELLAILRAFGATEHPQRGTSHRQFDVTIKGRHCRVTVDESIDDFNPADTYGPLWVIVNKQLQISWEDFYSADRQVARRANVRHRPPA